MKVVFGHGGFGNTLRIEISDAVLATAETVLERLNDLATEFDAQFSANLAIIDGPGDYGQNRVWLAISAGPNIEVMNANDEVSMALSGKTMGEIILESGGWEGPNVISYDDVRDMPNIYVDTMVSGEDIFYKDKFFHPQRHVDKWVAYVLDISTTNEEYEAIMVAGRAYEDIIGEEADRWEKETKEEEERHDD